MEKFRVISDLHLDINVNYPIKTDKDDIFTVIAGDTSGEWTVVEYSCKDRRIDVKIEKHTKLAEYFGKLGKNGIVDIFYDASEKMWKNVKTHLPIDIDKAGLTINNYMTNTISDGTIIKFRFFDTERWIRKNISKGVIIAGNHIVYNREKKTIEELKKDLHEKFNEKDDITFLDQSVGVMTKEIDGILFIGSTLYTDYEYIGENSWRYGKQHSKEENISLNLRLAMPKMSGGGLNDFNRGRTFEGTYKKQSYDKDDGIYYLSSKNYLNWFHKTVDEIKRIVEDEKNKEKDIVIVSHHCPSPKCISKEYVDSELNASYISDLDEFITSHPNIKCWCCGHVHHRDSFKIENCLVVMNPLGYCSHGQYKSVDGSENWSFDTFVNTKTWELEKEKFDITKWNKKYEAAIRRRAKLYAKWGGFFF